MTNQTNQGVYIPQKQIMLLLASIMITISVAIIFSAMFITNLVQGKVASAQAQQPNASQAAATRTQTPGVVYAEWSYEDPYAGCTVPTGGRGGESTSQQATSSSTPTVTRAASSSSAPVAYSTYKAPSHYSKPTSYTTPKYNKSKSHASNNISNSYNNSYNNSYTKNDIDNSVKNINSFNQGSFNNVKGDLTQTNNNNSNVDTKIINNQNSPQKPHKPHKPHEDRGDRGEHGHNGNNPRNNDPRENSPRDHNNNNRDNDHRNNDERDNRQNRGQNQGVTATVTPEATTEE